VSVQGTAAAGSGGIIIGVVQKLDAKQHIIPEYHIEDSQHTSEVQRFEAAVAQARLALEQELDALSQHGHGNNLRPILEAHDLMLADPELHSGTVQCIHEENMNVEWALKRCLASFTQAFAHMDDAYLQSRQADIMQVGSRILNQLSAVKPTIFQTTSIIISPDFSPADVVGLWREGVAGFVTAQGGKDSHAMIVARGVGLTGLAGAQALWAQAKDGDRLIVDAERHTWILNPTPEQEQDYQAAVEALQKEQKALQDFVKQTPITQAFNMSLFANVEFVEEVVLANQYGVDGIGLFRTEFLFMQSETLPDEDVQYAYYQGIVQGMRGKPVTFRLLDVGADKLAHARTIFGDYDGENPALGLRGVRMLLHKPELLKTQLRAILRCAHEGDISVLVPMVVSAAEMVAVRKVMLEVQHALKLDKSIDLGCMIEVPAAALIAHDLAKVSDFFSIGSNDLVQYTLAVDRADEHVDYLYDASHPAIYNLIQMAAKAAQQHNIPVTVCGELAASKAWTQAFVDMKINALSMAPSSVLMIRKHLSDLHNKL